MMALLSCRALYHRKPVPAVQQRDRDVLFARYASIRFKQQRNGTARNRATDNQDFPMNPTKLPVVYSMHWDNIPDNILQQQRAVFEHLQIELIQENANKTSHGTWMKNVIERQCIGRHHHLLRY